MIAKPIFPPMLSLNSVDADPSRKCSFAKRGPRMCETEPRRRHSGRNAKFLERMRCDKSFVGQGFERLDGLNQHALRSEAQVFQCDVR